MSMSWWFDIIVILVLAFLVYVLTRLEKDTAGAVEANPDAEGAFEDEFSGFSLYPRKLIRQAGIIPDRVAWLYWLGKLLFAILLPLAALEFFSSWAPDFVLLLLAILGFFFVDLWLIRRRRIRKQKIERSLSYFIDLISAFLMSGRNLSQSFQQAARYGLPKSNPLSQEVGMVAGELEAGRDRSSAFTALAYRTGVDDLHRLAAVMNVGFRVGSPVSETLQIQSDLLRAKQWERGISSMNRKSLASLFPLMLVSIPMVLVLVFFPAGVQLAEIFSMFAETF